MNKEEFFNFLSLIYAFKDVVIGEETTDFDESINYVNKNKLTTGPSLVKHEEDYQELSKQNKSGSDKEENVNELDPEEWDPW